MEGCDDVCVRACVVGACFESLKQRTQQLQCSECPMLSRSLARSLNSRFARNRHAIVFSLSLAFLSAAHRGRVFPRRQQRGLQEKKTTTPAVRGTPSGVCSLVSAEGAGSPGPGRVGPVSAKKGFLLPSADTTSLLCALAGQCTVRVVVFRPAARREPHSCQATACKRAGDLWIG
jgi:hypothetical protein